jgi:site-specific DNA-methyltransferase (adenine-specific)
MDLIKLMNGDCLELMKEIPDNSIDMVLCDLPYGTTSSKWDIIIPFEPLWEQYIRIVKEKTPIILFASQPFTSLLISSNLKMFRYNWVWNKKITGNPLLAKYQPLKIHEDICVFSKKSPNYYPQMRDGKMRKTGGGVSNLWGMDMSKTKMTDKYFPVSIIEFYNSKRKLLHPTQKPYDLLKYLINTYTKEGDIILDNTMGSGSTGVAAVELNRKFIGIEKDEKYFEIAKNRIFKKENNETN